MISKLMLIALPALLLAACAQPSAPPPAPAPAAPPPTAPAPVPEPAVSTAPIPIRTLDCAELIGASDEDRAAASLFFIGYQASSQGVRNLSIAEIQAIEGAALQICAANPQMNAVRAFRQAVRTRGR